MVLQQPERSFQRELKPIKSYLHLDPTVTCECVDPTLICESLRWHAMNCLMLPLRTGNADNPGAEHDLGLPDATWSCLTPPLTTGSPDNPDPECYPGLPDATWSYLMLPLVDCHECEEKLWSQLMLPGAA